MKHFLNLLIMILVLGTGVSSKAETINTSIKRDIFNVLVDSKCVPWSPKANKSMLYGIKKRDRHASPTIFKVKPGKELIIQNVSGDVYADWPGHNERKTDANGYSKTLNTYAGILPSSYIDEQINHMALIGTFANRKGVIVGTPFFIGNGPINLIVPEGAEQLQLGINDNLFKDNHGLFEVNINIDN